MKKIMFNDKYGLTDAVICGRKTMTRRVVKENTLKDAEEYVQKIHGTGHDFLDYLLENAPYKVGEVVAVAQSYKECIDIILINWGHKTEIATLVFKKMAGWLNKMFVKADLMPHRIRITDIKVERLQDISEEDVYKEGFSCVSVNNGWGNYANHFEAVLVYYDQLGMTKTIQNRDPREAFAILIDKVSGLGTWERNPWVFVYSFESVK